MTQRPNFCFTLWRGSTISVPRVHSLIVETRARYTSAVRSLRGGHSQVDENKEPKKRRTRLAFRHVPYFICQLAGRDLRGFPLIRCASASGPTGKEKERKKEPPSTDRHRLSDGRRQAGKTLQPDNHSGSSFHSLRIPSSIKPSTQIFPVKKKKRSAAIHSKKVYTVFRLGRDRPLLDAPDVVCRPSSILGRQSCLICQCKFESKTVQWWLRNTLEKWEWCCLCNIVTMQNQLGSTVVRRWYIFCRVSSELLQSPSCSTVRIPEFPPIGAPGSHQSPKGIVLCVDLEAGDLWAKSVTHLLFYY